MNWLLLVLGIPSGVVVFYLGAKLSKKTKSPTLKGLLRVVPLSLLCLVVVLIDSLI